MILQNFKNRFEILKAQGHHIQYVLDIGAYRGDFTETIKAVWPTAIVKQFEADDRQLPYLQPNAFIGLLGDKVQDAVDFFTLADDKITTGSSIFKELTPHYTDSTTVVMQKSMTTIDELDKKHKFFGTWNKNGLVKIDTQGSELLILTGASNFIQTKKPKYILLECSVTQYNQGAPRLAEVISYMDKLNYVVNDVCDLTYGQSNNLIQLDILFEREN